MVRKRLGSKTKKVLPRRKRLSFDTLEQRVMLAGDGVFTGQVFLDTDQSGYPSHGEATLAGWRVYHDANENGAFDEGERSVTTDASGSYRLDCLPIERVHVGIEVQDGFESVRSTTAADLRRNAEATHNFFVHASSDDGYGQINGYTYFDHDQDGRRPSLVAYPEDTLTPPGAARRVVYVDLNNNGAHDAEEPRSTSDEGGFFSFANVPRGDQVIRIEHQSGWVETSPSAVSVYVGNSITHVDFGAYSSTIAPSYHSATNRAFGVVWNDLNGSSTRWPNEPTLAGWTVFADLNANQIRDADEPFSVTDEFVVYRIDAPIGHRVLMVELQSGWFGSGPRDGRLIKVHNFNLAMPSGYPSNRHFGVVETETARGIVFEDLNGNDRRDAGEPGLGGWRVFATPIQSARGESSVYRQHSSSTVTAADGTFKIEVPGGEGRKIKIAPDNLDGPLHLYGGRMDRTYSSTTQSHEFGVTLGLDAAEANLFDLRNRVHKETRLPSARIVDTPDGYLISQRGYSRYFAVEEGSLAWRHADDLGPNAYWDITHNEDGSLTFQNIATGLFLDGDADTTNGWFGLSLSTSAGDDDAWFVEPREGYSRFGVLGDYGQGGPDAQQIAATFGLAAPDFMVGLGDGRYSGSTYDDVHGLYCEYLQGVQPGPNCPSGGDSLFNRFFAAAGNHDYEDAGGIDEYRDYFNLPGSVGANSPNQTGSELYYDFQYGRVHFFVIDSQAIKDDPAQAAVQRQWLADSVPTSEADWQVVVSHHPPYSSGSTHGSDPDLQFPYADWGVDMVMASHEHSYERLERGGVTYVVNGLGGRSKYNFGDPILGSQFRYNDSFGGMIFETDRGYPNELRGWFLTAEGYKLDEFTVARNAPLGVSSIVAEAGEDRTSSVGRTTYLEGKFRNEEHLREVFTSWSLTSRPAGSQATIANSDMPTAAFMPDAAGVYEAQFLVRQNGVESFDTVRIEVGEGSSGGDVWILRNRVHTQRVLSEAADQNAELQLRGATGSVWVATND
ncbi:MAG: metallophosphoesterase, partial [Planctomycetota bacterium]